jgi:iron complex transport system permease protein
VREVRLPEAITRSWPERGLAASALMMQTLFRNPLAGPGVLGISSGASLGVGIMMLLRPAWSTFLPDEAAVVVAAIVGSLAVLVLIMFCDRRVGDGTTLLIIGLMIGYLCGALIDVLQAASPASC